MMSSGLRRRLRSGHRRAVNAARRAGCWPGQPHWLRSVGRQFRVALSRSSGRALGGRALGGLPWSWISSVALITPYPALGEHVQDITPGFPARTLTFPTAPPGFEGFTRSVTLPATSDFLATNAFVSPRSGLVWLGPEAVLGESYGSLPQLLSWGYAAHDLFGTDSYRALDTDAPVLCIPSVGYFHLLLERLPALLRVVDRGGPMNILLWSVAPRSVRDVAELLLAECRGDLLEAPEPVRVAQVRVASQRAVSGHFDAPDLARLRGLADRVALGGRDTSDCIFVTRNGAARDLANEAEVGAALQARGFSVVNPGRLSLPEQMAVFQRARTVVGAHGAGLANLAFCAPGTRVLEIITPGRKLDCYARLAHLAGLGYRPLLAGAAGDIDLHQLSSALAAARRL